MPKLELTNGALTVGVNTDLGAEITKLAGADDTNLLFAPDWQTPTPANRSKTYGSDALDWLSEYRGGWQELFPNAGNPCTVLGTPLPFHGEVSRAQWAWQWLDEGRSLRLTVGARLPLVLERTMTLDAARPILTIEERIRNESLLSVPYIWGHHPAYSAPLATPGAQIDLPGGRVVTDLSLDGPAVDLVPGSEHRWPHATGRDGSPVDLSVVPEAPIARLCYLSELSAGWYAIRNPQAGIGAALAWDVAVFPNLWLWQEIEGSQGMPWYGRGQITALEPATQWPSHGLAAAIEKGQAHVLEPGAETSTRLVFSLFEASDRPVIDVSREGVVRLMP